MSVVAVAVVVSGFRCCAVGDDGLCLVACCDQGTNTALLLACMRGHLDVVRWLVTDAGSDARSKRAKVGWRRYVLRIAGAVLKFSMVVVL
jgi:hypothetical protein